MLDDIIKDVWREMYLTSAVKYANYEEDVPQEAEIIREVVGSRLASLDPSFLGILDAYAKKAKEDGSVELESLIKKVRMRRHSTGGFHSQNRKQG